MDNEVTIKNVHLDGPELWDLKISLYDNYNTIIDADTKRGWKHPEKDGDAQTVAELAKKLCHTSISEIENEVNGTGISEYD